MQKDPTSMVFGEDVRKRPHPRSGLAVELTLTIFRPCRSHSAVSSAARWVSRINSDQSEFSTRRCTSEPICRPQKSSSRILHRTEQGIAGFGIGLAAMGHTAVAEMQYVLQPTCGSKNVSLTNSSSDSPITS